MYLLSYIMNNLKGKWVLPIVLIVFAIGFGLKFMIGFFVFMVCVAIASAMILVWIIIVVIKLNKRKGESQNIKIEGFNELEKRMIEAKEYPWYLMIGSQECGKTTLLRNSDIGFSYIDSLQRKPINQGIEETRNFDLFYTKELDTTGDSKSKVVIIDTSGRYVIENQEAQVRNEWLAILSLLKKHLNNPIKGLILAVDIASLLHDEDKITRQAEVLRNQIHEIINVLGFRFQIYIVFTKCDSIYGFTQFSNILGKDKSTNIFGCTLESHHQKDSESAFNDTFKKLLESLNTNLLSNLNSASEEERKAAYAFLSEIDSVCQDLTPFIVTLFPAIHRDRPIFRGFYFTSAIQESPTVDLVFSKIAKSLNLDPATPESATMEQIKPKAYFIKDVFNKVIFPDPGLASPTRDTDNKKHKKRLLLCGIALAISLILTVMFTISYFKNRHLIENVSNSVKNKDFEILRKSIVGLEQFGVFSTPWHNQRNDVAEEARRFYLLSKYRDDTNYEYKFSRTITIPVNMVKGENKEPIAKADVMASIGGKQYKQKTDKNGKTVFKIKVRDGKVNVVFSTVKKEPGYINLPKKTCEINPGDKDKEPILLTFSKFTITVHCIDQNGENLKGVPISITINGLTPKGYNKQYTSEEGYATIEFDAKEGNKLLVYYDESVTNYKGKEDEIAITQEFEYSKDKQLQRKTIISDNTKDKSSDDPNVRTDVSGSEIPPQIILPQIKSIKIINESGGFVKDAEIWVKTQNNDVNLFNFDNEMEYESDKQPCRLVKLKITANNVGIFNIPKDTEGHQILICHPDYWPQNIEWNQIKNEIKMISINKERLLSLFDRSQKDGAEQYYKLAHTELINGKEELNKAIEHYKKSIRLMPTIRAYAGLGWAYIGKKQFDDANKQLIRGRMINLLGFDTTQYREAQSDLQGLEKSLRILKLDMEIAPEDMDSFMD